MKVARFRPELNLLRFFAFFCVFLDHIREPFPRWFMPVSNMGTFGLCIFLLLSAYLIVTLLLAEREDTGTVNVAAFAVRRILRIWPLYFVVIFLGCMYRLHLHDPMPVGVIVSLLTLSANIDILRHGWRLTVLSALWSISIEEQFYLVMPWLGKFASQRVLAWFFGAVLLLAYLRLWVLGGRHASYLGTLWPDSFIQFQFFAVGGFLALWLYRRPFALPGAVRAVMVAAGLGAWFFAAYRCRLHTFAASTRATAMVGYGCALLGSLLLFLAVFELPFRIPRVLVYLGTISYGLYLFHPFYMFLFMVEGPELLIQHKSISGPLALAATIATAALSYRYFERPILQLKSRFEVVRTPTP